jgi:hypothetical protein
VSRAIIVAAAQKSGFRSKENFNTADLPFDFRHCVALIFLIAAIAIVATSSGGYAGWSKGKAAIDKAAKLKQHWTVHGLRRTVRTGLGMLGVLPHVAEAVLNHLPAKLIRTYDRNTYAAEKKAALDAWANHLEAIISPTGKAVAVRAVTVEGAGAEKPRAAFAERLAGAGSKMSQRPSIKGRNRSELH